MVKYFAVENFKSIKNKMVVEFDLNIENFQTDTQSWSAHPVIAFYGSNASGKTTILQALTFVWWFMQKSFLAAEPSSNIPREPFILSKDKNSTFHLIFELDGIEYNYFLECDDQKVIKEDLYVGDNEEATFERVENDLLQAAIHLDNVNDLRQNCSIISYAAQFKSQAVAQKLQQFTFTSNCTKKGYTSRDFNPTIWGDLKNKYGEQAKAMLQLADIGIADFGRKAGESKDYSSLEELINDLEPTDIPNIEEVKQKIQKLLTFSNQTKIRKEPSPFVLHTVEGQEIELDPDDQQSEGTKRFASLILKVLAVLNEGGVLILDEFETNLHQDLAAYVLGLFNNYHRNTKNGQLIISSHNSHFMDFLNPEQVWFASKNNGITKLYSAANVTGLENVKERLNSYYKIGRFGAKPPALPTEQVYFPKNPTL